MILVVFFENILNCIVDRMLRDGFAGRALHRRILCLDIEIILNNKGPQAFVKHSLFCNFCLDCHLKCCLTSFFLKILL